MASSEKLAKNSSLTPLIRLGLLILLAGSFLLPRLAAGQAAQPNFDDAPEFFPFGRPAAIHLPIPPVEPSYKPGVDRTAYWKGLCERYGGNFIFRRIPDVDGIYQIRPRVFPSVAMTYERFRLESPIGMQSRGWGAAYMPPFDPADANAQGSYERFVRIYETRLEDAVRSFREGMAVPRYNPGQFFPERDYKFVEQPNVWNQTSGAAPFVRSFRNPEMKRVAQKAGDSPWSRPQWENTQLITREVARLKARYGFTWRGIPMTSVERELGIAGEEVIVLDLETHEVLGVRRTFLLSTQAPAPARWDVGVLCPVFGLYPYDVRLFLQQVLVPSSKERYEE